MARYAPALTPTELERMTPPEARYVQAAVIDLVNDDRKLELERTKGIMRSNGARVS